MLPIDDWSFHEAILSPRIIASWVFDSIAMFISISSLTVVGEEKAQKREGGSSVTSDMNQPREPTCGPTTLD